MVGSRRFLIIGKVAGDAGGRQGRVLAVNVAARARDGRMFSGQRELGRIVIEDCAQPLCGGVAGFTGLRE